MDFVEMPDVLPGKFESWLHFYYEVTTLFTKYGYDLKDDTDILYSHFEDLTVFAFSPYDRVDFRYKIKFGVVKLRAFDEIINTLPNFKDLIHVRECCLDAMYRVHRDDTAIKFFADLMKLIHHKPTIK